MPLSFKLSIDLSDFEDDEFLHDLRKVYTFYDNVIDLEYKLFKETVIKQSQGFFSRRNDRFFRYGCWNFR